MRPIQLFIAASLDGYIAGLQGEIDWLLQDQDYNYTPFYNQVRTVIVGRKTYEVCQSFAAEPFAGKEVFVLSRKNKGKKFLAPPLAQWIPQLQSQGSGTIWLVGGGEVVSGFLAGGWIDEIILSLHPILLGGGVPLFPAGFPPKNWELVANEAFSSGLAQLTYKSL